MSTRPFSFVTNEVRVRALKKPRLFFYRPSWYWFGWATILPVQFGHDEYSRKTIVFGWSFTGRAIYAYKLCGENDCYIETLNMVADEGMTGDEFLEYLER